MKIFSGSWHRNQYLFPIPTGLGAYRARGYYPAGQHPDRMQMYAGPLWARARQGLDAGRRPDRRRHAGRHHHSPRL